MQSKAINDVEVQLLIEMNLIELYSDIHAVGCFTCSDDDFDDDECVDICHDTRVTLSPTEWKVFFSDTKQSIDHGCGHAIINVLNHATQTSILPF